MEHRDPYDLSWMDERIERVEHSNWLYKFCCFFLFRARKKLSYNEMFVLLYGLNRKLLGHDDARKYAMAQVVDIYKYLNNNKLPNMKTNER